MNSLIPITLFGWIPVVLLLFYMLPARRAALCAFIVAWMFLPEFEYKFSGFPDYNKITATSLGVMIGMMVFDFGALVRLRFCLLDVPVLLYCMSGMAASINNDLGFYNGAAEMLETLMMWGVPYLVGRTYYTDRTAMKEVAVGIFVGGLVYVPLCLWEMRMGATLHFHLYGLIQHKFAQSIRPGLIGDFRPMVFMQTGLMVSFWMVSATLAGLWLTLSGVMRRLWGVPVLGFVGVLFAVTWLCNSTGSSMLVLVGVGLVGALVVHRSRVPMLCLLLVAPTYMVVRAADVWTRQDAVELVGSYGLSRQARSLDARMEQEDLFSDRAWQHPIFGWGGFDRMRPRDENGVYLTRGMDSLWVVTLGTKGLFGLTMLTLMMLAPFGVWMLKTSPRDWLSPEHGASAAMGMIILLWMVDCLLNGMVNPAYVMALGGLGGYRYSVASASGLMSLPETYAFDSTVNDRVNMPIEKSAEAASDNSDESEPTEGVIWRPVIGPVFDERKAG